MKICEKICTLATLSSISLFFFPIKKTKQPLLAIQSFFALVRILNSPGNVIRVGDWKIKKKKYTILHDEKSRIKLVLLFIFLLCFSRSNNVKNEKHILLRNKRITMKEKKRKRRFQELITSKAMFSSETKLLKFFTTDILRLKSSSFTHF